MEKLSFEFLYLVTYIMKAVAKHNKQKTSKSQRESLMSVYFWDRKYMMELFIFAFSFLLFANSIPNNYNMDDELVTINHRLTSKGIAAIPEIFASPYYQDAAGYSYEYRPVVLASFAIEHDIFGENPHWGHFWNVILYSLTCVLLYKVLRLLFKSHSALLAFGISLLFVAHPAHTEVVCSIKNRDEILGLMFSLISFYIVLRATESQKYGTLILVPVFFLLAMMSKITVVSFAIIIPLSLVLLTECSFLFILLVTTLFTFQAFLLISTILPSQKLILVLLVYIVVIFFYIIKNPKSFWISLQAKIEQARNLFSFQTTDNSQSSLEFSIPKLREIIPDSTILLSKYALGFIVATTLYHLALVNQLSYLVLILPIACSVFLFWGPKKLQWWGGLSLYVIIGINAKFYLHNQNFNDYFYIDLAKTFILFQIFYGNRLLLLPSIFVLAVVFYFSPTTVSVFEIIPNILFFVFLRFSYLRLAFILFFAVSLILHFSFSGLLGAIFTTLLPILIIQFWSKKQVPYLVLLYPLLIILISHSNFYSNELKPTVVGVVNIVDKAKLDLVDVKQNRPLNFAEQCVSVNDPFEIKVGTSLLILSKYLQKVVVPYPMSFYYGYKYIYPQNVKDSNAIITLVFYLALLVFAIVLIRKFPEISIGILSYIISVLVFSNYLGPIPGMLADRFLLIPSIGWLIFFVFALTTLFYKGEKNAFSWKGINVLGKLFFTILLVAYTSITFSRNFMWKNYLTLAKCDIKYVDNSSQAHNLLGLRLMKESYETADVNEQNLMHHEALMHFKRAVEIYPPFFNATYDIARVFSILNQTDSAIVYYQRTLQLDSTFTNANMALGEIYFQQQRLDDARANFEKLIKAFPTNSVGYDKVSYIYFLQKEYLKSIAINKMAIEKMPSDPQPCIAIAKAFYTMQQFDSSRVYLKKALQINPSHQEANALLQNLGSR